MLKESRTNGNSGGRDKQKSFVTEWAWSMGGKTMKFSLHGSKTSNDWHKKNETEHLSHTNKSKFQID